LIFFLANECEPIWDDFICWTNSTPGMMVKISCRDVLTALQLPPPNDSTIKGKGHLKATIFLVSYFVCLTFVIISDSYAFRICKDSGQWLWQNYTNYTNCLSYLPSSPVSIIHHSDYLLN
jgi:hypothetical protein